MTLPIYDLKQLMNCLQECSLDGYITSSWSGQVYHISSDYTVTKLLDTEDEAIGAADIEYIAKEKLLLVPTFYYNRLMAYRVELK